jgi:hypothetical protein
MTLNLESGSRFPKKYQAGDAPASVLRLVGELLPQLVEGDHPALAALRLQVPQVRISEVELTGSGFYADFELPASVPLAKPLDFAGGDAVIKFVGAPHQGGCVLFVRGGRLATLEGYTYGDDIWAEDAVVTSISDVVPVLVTEL